MSLEEEYNKIISEKLNSRSFTPSEEDWQDALALIKANEEKKKRGFLFWFILAGVIGGASLFYLVTDNGNVINKNELSVKKEENPANFKSSKIEETESRTNEQTLTNANTEVKNLDKNSEGQNPIEEHKLVTQKENSDPIFNSADVNKHSGKTQKTHNTSVSTKRSYSSKGSSQNNSTIAKNAPEKEIGSQEKDRENKNAVTITQNTEVNPKDEVATAIPETTSKTDSLTKPILNDSLATLPKGVAEKDTMVTQIVPAIASEKLNKVSTFEIFALGGIQFTTSKNSIGNITRMINPNAGLYFIKSFASGFGFGSGIFYSIYSANEQTPKKFSSVAQEFGYKKSVTEITPNKFHYLKIPIIVSYSFGKNKIFGGPQFSYMINCRSTINTYEESYGIISNSKSSKSFGYSNGINRYDVSLMLGYSRTIYRRVGVGTSFDYGFIDTKSNSYFMSNTFERNIAIQVFINYKIK